MLYKLWICAKHSMKTMHPVMIPRVRFCSDLNFTATMAARQQNRGKECSESKLEMILIRRGDCNYSFIVIVANIFF